MEIIISKPSVEEIQASGCESWRVWECQPSEFDWYYDSRETCLILQGEISVITASGSVNISQGDFVVFPEGLSCKWIVHSPVRKHYRFG